MSSFVLGIRERDSHRFSSDQERRQFEMSFTEETVFGLIIERVVLVGIEDFNDELIDDETK
jgi:hypothetical protein